MISHKLREQLLRLTPDEVAEVRELLHESERNLLSSQVNAIREIRKKIGTLTGSSAQDELGELRENGWR